MTLFLLPNCFDDSQPPQLLLPSGLDQILLQLNGLVAESERTGRRYLLKILPRSSFARELPILTINEHSTETQYEEIISKVLKGESWGVISDAGMPGIADPGSRLVHMVRSSQQGSVRVIPGPSSILLALIASGLDGQRFSFNGYLPRESTDRRRELVRLEKESTQNNSTQICIETPYRNSVFFQDCLHSFHETTQLCVACRLTYEDETVETRSIKFWKKHTPDIRKEPTVFVFKA